MGTIDLHVAQNLEEIPLLRGLPEAGGPRRIRVSFSRYTEESIEQGDSEETGWEDEEGVPMEPDWLDQDEGITAIDKASTYLLNEGVYEASSSEFHSGMWYMADTGWEGDDLMEYHYFPTGFTEEEERALFENVVRGRGRR